MDGAEAVSGASREINTKKSSLEDAAIPFILTLLDRIQLWERWPLLFRTIHLKMSLLHGAHRAAEQTRILTAALLLHIAVMAVGFGAISIWAGSSILQAGCAAILLYGFYRFKKLDTLVRNRHRAIVMELPELINKMILLINAGETIHQAIHRCCPSRQEAVVDDQPLQQAWQTLSRELKDNKPFIWAMEEFSRSCGVLEVSMFSTAVLLNFRRGGTDFVTALQDLSHTLWERRKATARTIGEEAAAKLVFPMVLLFCTVMVIVAAPAILMMN
jgi:tight adherence protein C